MASFLLSWLRSNAVHLRRGLGLMTCTYHIIEVSNGLLGIHSFINDLNVSMIRILLLWTVMCLTFFIPRIMWTLGFNSKNSMDYCVNIYYP